MCGWLTPRPGRFTPGKDPVPTVQEAGWAPGPVSIGTEIPPPELEPRTVQPVASRYTESLDAATAHSFTYLTGYEATLHTQQTTKTHPILLYRSAEKSLPLPD